MMKKLLAGALKEKGYRYEKNVGQGGFGANFSISKAGKRFAIKF